MKLDGTAFDRMTGIRGKVTRAIPTHPQSTPKQPSKLTYSRSLFRSNQTLSFTLQNKYPGRFRPVAPSLSERELASGSETERVLQVCKLFINTGTLSAPTQISLTPLPHSLYSLPFSILFTSFLLSNMPSGLSRVDQPLHKDSQFTKTHKLLLSS